eukprot:TRINITY_DN67891_c0_g1_i1.p1 TRINITY_DN67891_c0_g1~~TRINITY_DN67891_c0_g1_i1.p1  ORF type:complete len:609 (-),score=88.00 TRINITY_DN67891_c0_g1_i1:121-1812(-)
MTGVVDFSFSIHQDLWHDAWVAATSTTRGRKKIVDFNVHQRVLRFIESYGPQSDVPLTLRVYGTMLKGFCVINNERARVLQGDCERVVILFAQQPSVEEAKGIKLPAAKRQRVDALTLDLDLAKVREAEAFDWTQAPLEEGVLLQLRAGVEDDFSLQLPPSGSDAVGSAGVLPCNVSLLQQEPLLDEAFPPLDAPQIEAHEQEVTDVAAAAIATVVEPRPESAPDALALLPHANVSFVSGATVVAAGEAVTTEGKVVLPLASSKRPKRRASRLTRPLMPGHVFGFDEEPLLSIHECDKWQRDVGSITSRCMEAADYAEMMASEKSEPDHLGPLLRLFVDPLAEALRPIAAGSSMPSISVLGKVHAQSLQDEPGDNLPGLGVAACAAAAGEWPELPPTSAATKSDGMSGENAVELGSMVSTQAPQRALVDAGTGDLFRPYVPAEPLPCAHGAGAELMSLFSGPHAAFADEHFKRGRGEPQYDRQTERVATVFRKYLAAAKRAGFSPSKDCVTDDRVLALGDLVPIGTTSAATAACAFHALLTLATVGELKVEQKMPYGPISMFS